MTAGYVMVIQILAVIAGFFVYLYSFTSTFSRVLRNLQTLLNTGSIATVYVDSVGSLFTMLLCLQVWGLLLWAVGDSKFATIAMRCDLLQAGEP